MQFLYQSLTIGFLLTLLPVLIHLINMMRHRRVKWAAMEFLLQSYKKHRKWVWMKQLLLLLMRMLAVALIVAMVAQWITRGQWLDILGGKATHHYVILDDSASMSDRTGAGSAFENASRFLQRLATQAAEEQLPQRLTLIRYSRAAGMDLANDQGDNNTQLLDFNAEDIDGDFPARMEEKRITFEVTQLATGPRPALEMLRQMLTNAPDENRVVYVVSDFRTNQWETPTELKETMAALERSGAAIHLVDCVRTRRPNLAIVDVRPVNETRAAGVPLFVNIRVRNYGTEPAEKVQLKVRTMFHDPRSDASSEGQPTSGTVEDLPVVMIDSIGGGETVTKRVQVYFPEAGKHVVEASLPEDPVAADNSRWCVVPIAAGEPVLIVDGDPGQLNAFYVNTIFQPGQRARTGVQPDLQPAAFLRDANLDALQQYTAIYLFDVPRLDDRAIENLKAYVRGGGGLAFFAGPQMNLSFYTESLYREGDGLFPLPLARDDLLPPSIDEAPDIDVEGSTHPIFSDLLAGQNPIIRIVRVERYLRPPSGWTPPVDSTIKPIASLRNGSPLVVEKQYGEGRVIAVLTTYAPYWNDLVLGPNVLITLKLHSYLGTPSRADEQKLVGTPIELTLDSERYRQDVRFFAPSREAGESVLIDRPAERPTPNSPIYLAGLRPQETMRSGVYETWANTSEGQIDVFRYAVNVDPDEGDLETVAPQPLLARLAPLKPQWRYADQYDAAAIQQGGFNRSLLLMCLLVALLLGEQLMAYSASYHPARGATR